MNSLYQHAALYALLHDGRTHDLPWYEASTRGWGRTLELGAGTGRVTVALARAGLTVTAVDLSAEMLAMHRERLAQEPEEVRCRVRLVEADIGRLVLGERFPGVLFPYNGLAHALDDSALSALLARVKLHLDPGGTFLFDTVCFDQRIEGASQSVPWFRHPVHGDACRSVEVVTRDAATGVLTILMEIRAMESDRPVETTLLRLRPLEEAPLRRLLEQSGFQVVSCMPQGDELFWNCRIPSEADR